MEARKIEELKEYERIYSEGKDFSDSDIREGLLHESEQCFIDLVKKFAPNKKVLEIGCGRGKHSLLAAAHGAQSVTGIDISQNATLIAQKSASALGFSCAIEFLVMDAESLQFKDDSFDLVINHESFSSLDFNRSIQEIYRVLKPGGFLIAIECLGHNPIFNLNRSIKSKVGKRTSWAANNIITLDKINQLNSRFHLIYLAHFSLTSILAWPLLKLTRLTQTVKIFQALDRFLLKFRRIQKFSFKAVFMLQKNITAPGEPR